MSVLECSGAPRDLGRDLGTALGAELRAAAGGRLHGWLAAFPRRKAIAALHRDLRRYFPHQSEWLEGLALGAGVPMRALVHALAASCDPAMPQGVAVGAVAGTATVACSVPSGALLRRVAPEGRFRSLEIAMPGAPAPVIGLNEAGLAVAVAQQRSLPGRFAPPIALFARDCLERFERVEPALDWCLARPAAPGGSLVFADAYGELAGIYASGPTRRALRPLSCLVLGDENFELSKPEQLASGDLTDELANALALLPGMAFAAIADPVGCRLRTSGGGWHSPVE